MKKNKKIISAEAFINMRTLAGSNDGKTLQDLTPAEFLDIMNDYGRYAYISATCHIREVVDNIFTDAVDGNINPNK